MRAKGYVNTGAIGRVTVEMPRHRKGQPRTVAPIGLAYYKGETEADALAFAAAVNASNAGLIERETSRPSPAFELAPCEHKLNEYGDYLGDGPTIHVGCRVNRGREQWDDRSGIYALAAAFDASRGKVRETIDALQTCNACDAIGPIHPVTGYCKRCQRAAVKATRGARKTKTTPAVRTPAAPAMAPTIVALDGGKAPCPRCGRSDWRTAAGRTWHLENNPDCAAYRKPARHAYATISA